MERNDSAAPAAETANGMPPEVADLLEPDAPAGGEQAESPNADFARNIGWRPLEEYRGPKDKWLPADDFIAKVEKETPIMRERLRSQATENERLRRENADYKKREEEGFSELIQSQREAKKRGFDYALERVESDMEDAVKNADTDSYRKLKQQRDQLLSMAPSAPSKETRKSDDAAARPTSAAPSHEEAVVLAWANENPWFQSDPEINNWAIGAEISLKQKSPHLSLPERLAKVRETAQKRFPEKFENTARNNPPAAARPGPQGARPAAGTKKAATFDDIPAGERESAKAAFAMIKRRTPNVSVEQYVKDYRK